MSLLYLARSTPRFLPRILISSTRSFSSQNRVYTKSHEWISFDNDKKTGTIGITNHAQAALGDIVFVDLPSIGKVVKQGGPVGAIESVKASSEIYSPVDGKVLKTNEDLSSQPASINESPYEKGWIVQIDISNPQQLDGLLSEEDYKKVSESQ
eukprot:TRINITY_DN2373_c0_g1_i1.p1 TRINITY_DN2373_c0_g1~~TRINITY_DN2373_c0_g1_i1.p1  ORF type:complete len:153 (-),score=33.93 TRINITY_DN2373_c0_g1_i1:139-597(-)